MKSQRQPKNLKRIHTSSTFGENTTQANAWIIDVECDIYIYIEGKSYTFKNQEIKFRINKDLSYNSKNAVYMIECNKCKEIYVGSTQSLNTSISLHKSNINIPENGKLNVSKHLYEYSQRKFKIMPIYQTNDYTLLQIKDKTLLINSSPRWIKHELYTQTNGNKHINTHIDR